MFIMFMLQCGGIFRCSYWVVLLFCHFSLFRSEKGTFYALDLGGTNFRILRVHLGGQRSLSLKNDVERQPIPQNLMTGTREVATVNMYC